MNKIISTKKRIFISLVGPSGSEKSHLFFDWLIIGTFQPAFDKIFYFYQHYQPLYSQMQRKNLKFIQGVVFDLIENLPNKGFKYLLIFDDSCEEISNSKQFVKIATAGRHRGLNTIYIKHNLFHQRELGRDVELQNTHIVLFKLLMGCFRNQYIKSTIRSRISIERVVSRCNIRSLWSFTY